MAKVQMMLECGAVMWKRIRVGLQSNEMKHRPLLIKASMIGFVVLPVFSSEGFAGEISFCTNGGSGSMPSVSHDAGAYVTLPQNTLRKSGYTFDGWSTKADGSGIDYSDGRKFFMPDSDLSLYAQWREPGCDIGAVGNKLVLEILRPGEKQTGPCYAEDYQMFIRAKHPDGVAKVQIFKPGSKIGIPEPSFSVFDRELGLFVTDRRFKSAEDRTYSIIIETKKGEVIDSSKVFGDQGWHNVSYHKIIPEYQGFINLQNGDAVQADKPLVVAVDCTDPDGSIRNERTGHGYPLDDLNGVLSVTLKVDGKEIETKRNAPENIVANETAAISFGYYKFRSVKLGEGQHTLSIESVDRKGNRSKPSSINLTAQ